jgi:hypothetical protein
MLPKQLRGNRGTMADTSLWPVVVGGLLAGLFALGGIGVGAVVASRRDAAQERREARKRRADKFEELVAAVYEFDHWLDSMRGHGGPQTTSPFSKVQSIAAVYFPQFSELISELNRVHVSIASGLSKHGPREFPITSPPNSPPNSSTGTTSCTSLMRRSVTHC